VTLGLALALVMVVSAAWIVVGAAAGSSPMVPRSPRIAGWLRSLPGERLSYRVFLSCLLTFTGAYVGLLPLIRRVPTRALVGLIACLYAIVFVGPVLVSTDVFSYIAYARMGVIHGLNPYVSVPFAIRHDPVYPFVGVNWIFVPSAYGPLYTLLSYPFALLGVVGAVWGMKAVALVACAWTDWLVWRCADRRGVDPKLALGVVALNPLVVIYSLASAQNDFVMIAPTALATYLLLRGEEAANAADGGHRPRMGGPGARAPTTPVPEGMAPATPAPGARAPTTLALGALRVDLREAWAAASVVGAALVKAPAVLLLPFIVAGRRRLAALVGAGASAAITLAVSYVVFGAHGVDIFSGVNRDSAYVSGDSFATQIAHMLGKPGVFPVDHTILKGMLALVVVYLLVRTWRGYDWVAGSGWALLAAAVTSTWLQAWYLIWPLPLAVLARDRRLLWGTLVIQALFVVHQLSPMFAPQ
jgi:hypothetical protein